MAYRSLGPSALKFLSLLLLIALVPTVSALKYEKWFYWYNRPDEPTLSTLENGICNQTFADYRLASKQGSLNGLKPLWYCYIVEDCMLDNMRASFVANYQAAAVILGITPTLLATLGPRIGEISLLSTTRPLLSFLISLGAPAVWPTRAFEYDDPSSSLGKGVNRRIIPRQSGKRALLFIIIEYMLVLGAIANVAQVAIILGKQTVLSWSCEFDWGPLVWGIIPVFIHLLAALSYHFEVRGAEQEAYRNRRVSETSNADRSVMTPTTEPQGPLSRRTTFIDERKKMSWFQREFTICANQPRGLASLLRDRKLPWFAVLFNCAASLCAFFHLMFGTMIFSSLTFIAVYDILNFVFWRYILSTVACRLVLLFELMGMREDEVKDVEKVADEVTKITRRLAQVESNTGITRSPNMSPNMSPRAGVTFESNDFEMKQRATTNTTLVERT